MIDQTPMPNPKATALPRIGRRVIGTRRLSIIGTRRKIVEIKVGIPKCLPDGVWACPYQIKASGRVRLKHAFGEDGLQAAHHALCAIRRDLDASAERLVWLDGEEGDTGFPRIIPHFHVAMTKRIERMIDKEVARFTRRLEARYLRKLARKKRTTGYAAP